MTKSASPLTAFQRRDKEKWGHPKLCNRKPTIARYPKKKFDKRPMTEEKWSEIQRLYHIGWKINWIAKKVHIDWHSVKRAVDEDYREKRNEMVARRMKRIMADPIKRKKQFAAVDAWRRKRLAEDFRYSKWLRHQRRLGTNKYDAHHAEERRVKAIVRYNNRKEEGKDAKQ